MKMTKPIVEVKLNNCATHEPCALCGDDADSAVGPWPFVRGTYEPVCTDCARHHGFREPFAQYLSEREWCDYWTHPNCGNPLLNLSEKSDISF
jgi:hypothetical protein